MITLEAELLALKSEMSIRTTPVSVAASNGETSAAATVTDLGIKREARKTISEEDEANETSRGKREVRTE